VPPEVAAQGSAAAESFKADAVKTSLAKAAVVANATRWKRSKAAQASAKAAGRVPPVDWQPGMVAWIEGDPAVEQASKFNSKLRRTKLVVILSVDARRLRAKVADQSFREDLFYRLAVLELHVPPLRERPEDVIPLAEAFLAREATRAGRPLAFDDGAREALRRHDWPGNVRELENAIVRLGVLADGPIVTARDVAECALGRRAPSPAATLPTLELAELERRAIAQALQRANGAEQALLVNDPLAAFPNLRLQLQLVLVHLFLVLLVVDKAMKV
jgi:hypothetical protein